MDISSTGLTDTDQYILNLLRGGKSVTCRVVVKVLWGSSRRMQAQYTKEAGKDLNRLQLLDLVHSFRKGKFKVWGLTEKGEKVCQGKQKLKSKCG